MTNRFVLLLILATAGWIGYSACNKTDRNPCLEPKKYFLKLKTYKPADTGTGGVDSVLPAAVVGYADTPLFFAGPVKSASFAGPLSNVADSNRWYILPDTAQPGIADTLTFYYTRKLTFLSTACGYTYIYQLNSIATTNNSIDSVRIKTAEVTNKNEVNVEVFY